MGSDTGENGPHPQGAARRGRHELTAAGRHMHDRGSEGGYGRQLGNSVG